MEKNSIRRLGKFLQLLRRFRAARFQSGDLTARALAAGKPGLAFFLDGVQTLFARLGVAQMGLQFGARFGHRGAILGRRRACRCPAARSDRTGEFQLGERGLGLRALLAGFVAGRHQGE